VTPDSPALPPETVQDIHAISVSLSDLPGAVTILEDLPNSIMRGIDQGFSGLSDAVVNALTVELDAMEYRFEGVIEDTFGGLVSDARALTLSIDYYAMSLEADAAQVIASLEYNFNLLCTTLQHLPIVLNAENVVAGVTTSVSLDYAAQVIADAIRDAAREQTGRMGTPSGAAPMNIGQSVAQGQIDGVSVLLQGNTGARDLPSLTRALKTQAADANNRNWYIELFSALMAPHLAWVKAKLAGQPTTQDTLDGRLDEGVAWASEMGLAAWALSAAIGALGCGVLDLNATGLAAMVAKFADFDAYADAVNSPFVAAWVARPWERRVRAALRPERPDVGKLLDLRASRHLESGPAGPPGEPTCWASMREKGYPEEWIRILMDGAYHHPPLRELLAFMESPAVSTDDAWLTHKLEERGYRPEDIPRILDALHAKAGASWRSRLVSAHVAAYKAGLTTLREFGSDLGRADLPADVLRQVKAVAAREAATERVQEQVAFYTLSYSKGQLTEQELKADLVELDLDMEHVNWVVSIEYLKRFHKVWILSDVEKAQEAVAWYRKAYIYGLLTEEEYEWALTYAQFDQPLINARLVPDRYERDRHVAADLAEWQLPEARDKAIQEDWTIGQYRSYLLALDFPDRFLSAEVALVAALQFRYHQHRVERIQLQTYEKGFMFGLFDEQALRRLYQEAGRRADEIEARIKVLRQVRASGGPGAPGANTAAVIAEAEWKFFSGEITEGALVEIERRLGVPPDRLLARLIVLRKMMQPPEPTPAP
jgi:hypothetical protein